jgi:hypothetical protein
MEYPVEINGTTTTTTTPRGFAHLQYAKAYRHVFFSKCPRIGILFQSLCSQRQAKGESAFLSMYI